jgi:hypothetical protein
VKVVAAHAKSMISLTQEERRLRESLDIPLDAERVLLFGESSHWDTNWLQTSEEYFTRRIEPIFEAVLSALERDPGRVYSIESLFFLKLYWERRPEQHARLRRLFEQRQLRMLANSYTTPDTLLPHPETILRDFQLGHAWLSQNGLPAEPGIAYFPDNFGHSPHLPSLMQAVGVKAVGLTRIDGMYFVASDYRRRDHFPRPGSTAELLEKVHRSHDFVWRDDDGAEILCHWNAHTYFQGDMLAHAGIIRWAGKVYAMPWRTRGHVARRIASYVRQLAPSARTPYLFCPIGMDFNDPIVDVRPLLERYNREVYPRTGTWTLLAGLDDYLALIDCHRAALPVLCADPNPYWMGFLATRPEVKQRSVRIARTLLLAEKLSATEAPDAELERALHEGWNTLVLTNHHDYIPGTSPDRVWEQEQKPWLDSAEASARIALELAAAAATSHEAACPGVKLSEQGELIHIETAHYRLTLSRARGGCLTSFVTAQREWLRGLGFDLVAFHDEGGLWRLGHEFAGGRFVEREHASQLPVEVAIEESPAGLLVRLTTQLCGQPFVRHLICRGDQPFVRLRVQGVAPSRTTVTARWSTALDPSQLEMDTVGGVIHRPRERLYSPTYWGVPSRLTLRDAQAVHGLAQGVEAGGSAREQNTESAALHALFESPTAASLGAHGVLDWIVARNAPKERAFGWLPVLAHPIGGTNPDLQVHEAALLAAPHALAAARQQLERCWSSSQLEQHAAHAALSLVRCDTPGVSITALKRSAAGEGLTLRLYCEQVPPEPVRLWLDKLKIRTALLCDALERPLSPRRPLPLEPSGCVVVPVAQRLTSLWLMG